MKHSPTINVKVRGTVRQIRKNANGSIEVYDPDPSFSYPWRLAVADELAAFARKVRS